MVRSLSSPTSWTTGNAARLALVTLLSATTVTAHEHDTDDIPEGSVVSPDPIDKILWLHILFMATAFGILFPTGMVLGLVRNRFHVPVQALGTVLAVVGWFLGHHHGGRQFKENVHASFAPWLALMLVSQVAFGLYLKLHLEKGWHGKVRRIAVRIHGVIGKAFPVASWVQMLFGGITALGFCHDDHLGQCLAHFIMGSSFIGYAIIMSLMMLVGQAWLKRSGKSPEFWDSLVIAVWGCINTFTEHRWGHPWAHNDIQHTSMGIVWWASGLLGLWLSKGKDGEPRRNVIPALVIFMTGWAMSSHPQHLPISTMIHAVFGYTLMAAGLTRMIEIAFVLRDQNGLPSGVPNSFQYLPPFLLIASGFIFMSATEEQTVLLASMGIDHVSYLLVQFSLAFLMFLYVNMLIHLYVKNTTVLPAQKTVATVETGRAQADEFELEGLISDNEDNDQLNDLEERSSGSSNTRVQANEDGFKYKDRD